MKIKNKDKANLLAQQHSDVIRAQVRYYVSKRARVHTAQYDEIYSEALLYVYSQIGVYDFERSAIQTFVANLAAQGVKRYFQNQRRDNDKMQHTMQYLANDFTQAMRDDATIQRIEHNAVLQTFIEYLQLQGCENEIRYINAMQANADLTYVQAAAVLNLGKATIHRIVVSIRTHAANWMCSKKVDFSWC